MGAAMARLGVRDATVSFTVSLDGQVLGGWAWSTHGSSEPGSSEPGSSDRPELKALVYQALTD